MTDEFGRKPKRLRRAGILVFASIVGGAAVCGSYCVGERRLRNRRREAERDEGFRELVERKRRE